MAIPIPNLKHRPTVNSERLAAYKTQLEKTYQLIQQHANELVKPSLSLLIDNTIYTLDPNTGNLNNITPRAILEHHNPTTYRTYYSLVTPPEPFFLIGPAGRRRILRSYQLHTRRPQITAPTTQYENLISSLEYYCPDSPFLAEYKAALWATHGQSPSLAINLLIYYGNCQNFPNRVLAGDCQYKLDELPSGIILTIDEPLTLQTRLNAACDTVLEEYRAIANRPKFAPIETLLLRAGTQRLYYQNNFYLSITPRTRTHLLTLLSQFIQDVCLGAVPPYPNILPSEINTTLPPHVHFLPYSSFIASNRSLPQQISIANRIIRHDNKTTTDIRYLSIPENFTISRADLLRPPYSFSDRELRTMLQHGLLVRESRGQYRRTASAATPPPSAASFQDPTGYDAGQITSIIPDTKKGDFNR